MFRYIYDIIILVKIIIYSKHVWYIMNTSTIHSGVKFSVILLICVLFSAANVFAVRHDAVISEGLHGAGTHTSPKLTVDKNLSPANLFVQPPAGALLLNSAELDKTVIRNRPTGISSAPETARKCDTPPGNPQRSQRQSAGHPRCVLSLLVNPLAKMTSVGYYRAPAAPVQGFGTPG